MKFPVFKREKLGLKAGARVFFTVLGSGSKNGLILNLVLHQTFTSPQRHKLLLYKNHSNLRLCECWFNGIICLRALGSVFCDGVE